MERTPASWNTVVRPIDRFNWLLGVRIAAAFAGPMVVAHLLGHGAPDAAIVSLAGLLVALIASALPVDRSQLLPAVALVVVLPLVAAFNAVVAPHGASHVVLLGIAGLLAGLAPLVSRGVAVISRAIAIGMIVTTGLPATAHTAGLLLVGGSIALAIVLVTHPLTHPRLALPQLPRPRPVPIDRADTIRHAGRLALVLAVAATFTERLGTGSSFMAHSSWMLLGAWIAMHPHVGVTRDTAMQRAVGTTIGAGLTILIAFMSGAVWLGWLFLVLAFIGFGMRSVNYAWYCVAITPVIVLGFVGPDLDTQVLSARVVWTIAGVALALGGRLLLWPSEGTLDAT